MEIDESLNYIKKTYNLTQSDMANLAGISQSTMSDWLNGKVNPTIKNLINIANKLNITLDYLVGRESEDSIILINNELTEDENNLLDTVRQLNNVNKEMVYTFANLALANQNKAK